MKVPPTIRPELERWVIPPEQREKIEALNATSAWLRNPPDSECFRSYRGQYVAARNCEIIAAADTMEELFELLKDEEAGTYMIASFKGGRIRVVRQ